MKNLWWNIAAPKWFCHWMKCPWMICCDTKSILLLVEMLLCITMLPFVEKFFDEGLQRHIGFCHWMKCLWMICCSTKCILLLDLMLRCLTMSPFEEDYFDEVLQRHKWFCHWMKCRWMICCGTKRILVLAEMLLWLTILAFLTLFLWIVAAPQMILPLDEMLWRQNEWNELKKNLFCNFWLESKQWQKQQIFLPLNLQFWRNKLVRSISAKNHSRLPAASRACSYLH